MAAMRSLTPARRNLNVLSRYDDSVARIESLTLNEVTDMRASRGFDSSWQIIHKDSTLQVQHFSCYFVPVALSLRIAAPPPPPFFLFRGGGEGPVRLHIGFLYMRWSLPRCLLRLGGWLFNSFYFKRSLSMKLEIQFLCLTFGFFRFCEG